LVVLRTYHGRQALQVSFHDITEREHAELQIQEYQRQLQTLSSELSLIEERERRAIASDLHDSIGQLLAITKIKFESLKQSAEDSFRLESMQEIGGLIDESIKSVRTLTFELSPPILYELGFEPALEWLSEKLSAEYDLEISCDFDENELVSLDNDIAGVLFKAVRELLMNIVKHARADKAEVKVRPDGTHVKIEVIDNGIGFDPNTSKIEKGGDWKFGLFNIQERINYLGGEFKLKSVRGQGTRISIALPNKREAN